MIKTNELSILAQIINSKRTTFMNQYALLNVAFVYKNNIFAEHLNHEISQFDHKKDIKTRQIEK